jgi:hypothetical protein
VNERVIPLWPAAPARSDRCVPQRLFDLPPAIGGRQVSVHDYARPSKAVELLLAAELLLRDHHVSIPFVDDGIDLIVDYRLLVQVKSSEVREAGAVRFPVDRVRPDVDIVACYARDTRSWWFVPRHDLAHAGVSSTLLLVEDAWSRRGSLSDFRDAWEVFERLAA